MFKKISVALISLVCLAGFSMTQASFSDDSSLIQKIEAKVEKTSIDKLLVISEKIDALLSRWSGSEAVLDFLKIVQEIVNERIYEEIGGDSTEEEVSVSRDGPNYEIVSMDVFIDTVGMYRNSEGEEFPSLEFTVEVENTGNRDVNMPDTHVYIGCNGGSFDHEIDTRKTDNSGLLAMLDGSQKSTIEASKDKGDNLLNLKVGQTTEYTWAMSAEFFEGYENIIVCDVDATNVISESNEEDNSFEFEFDM